MVGAIQERSYSWIQNEEKLPSNLYYLGPKTLEEVNGMLNGSLIHIHTCLAEGFPNVFIQAWLQGKPSVSYGFDPSNYIKDNQLGYCSSEDWDIFVSHVSDLTENRSRAEELGKNAWKFANEMFQVEKSVTKLEEVIHSL